MLLLLLFTLATEDELVIELIVSFVLFMFVFTFSCCSRLAEIMGCVDSGVIVFNKPEEFFSFVFISTSLPFVSLHARVKVSSDTGLLDCVASVIMSNRSSSFMLLVLMFSSGSLMCGGGGIVMFGMAGSSRELLLVILVIFFI